MMTFRRLDKEVGKWCEHHQTPGMVIGLTDAEAVLHVSTSGTSDRSRRSPVGGDTLFEIGSVTKTFTGIAVAQLADRGMLDLDASILDILPWARVDSPHPPFTVRHMVTHTAGLPSGRADVISSWYRGLGIGKLYSSAPPGTFFSYSDFGFHLLSIVIEVVSGRTYPEYIAENIFEPLGMKDSKPALLNAIRRYLASGYESMYDDRPYVRAHMLLSPPWYEHAEGDGCIASTPNDMLRYARMILNHGTGAEGVALLSPHAFEQFRTPFARKDDKTHYGMGIEIRRADHYTALEHEGVIAGYRAYLGAVMDAGVAVIALQNGPGDPTTIGRYALEVALAETGHGEIPDTPEPGMFHPPSDDTKYEGVYYDHRGRELLIERVDGALVLQGLEPIYLDQITNGKFFADHERIGVFPFHFHLDSGHADKILHGPTVYVRDKQAEAPPEIPEEWRPFCGQYRAMSTLLSMFRVTVREGLLYMITPDGDETQLAHIEGRTYRVGTDPRTPEWIEFGEVVEGQVLNVSLAGSPYYRCLTEKLPDSLVPRE